MENEIKRLEEEFQKDSQEISSPKDLEALKIKYLGRKSTFTQLFSQIPTLPPKERGVWGKRHSGGYRLGSEIGADAV